MEKKSFVEIYKEVRKSPTPAQAFIDEVAALTHRKPGTVKHWAVGEQVPDVLAKSILAERFGTDVATLFPFPPKRKRKEAQAS